MSDELAETESLLSSGIKSNKASAYQTLLHLQETSTADDSSIRNLAQHSPSLLNFIIDDVFDHEEEIAAQACKCLGFMIYHPSIIATISVDVAGVILQSLVKLIMNTNMKSVCNLGVWCISVQQFSDSFLNMHFDSLIMAVAHALDNPTGSLSTTYEAVQAVLKLATQLNERIKETSHLWAPSIYRRLISKLKKERDVSQRCLIKLESIIIPPIPTLSKVVVRDMKKELLSGLKELQSQGLIIQAIQAWGWFIALIGPHAPQNRSLLNDLLTFIEKAFTDHRSQVQIASLVVWERLIDALINYPLQACDLCVFINNVDQESRTFQGKHGTQANGCYKRIKLIMTPLIGIISSECDISVHVACMKAWCHLLYKLGSYINCPAVLNATFVPLLKVVFNTRHIKMSNWLWNLCIDMFDDSLSSKYVTEDLTSSGALKPLMNCVASDYECLRKHYPLKWLPWRIDQLKLYMDTLQVVCNQGTLTNVSLEYSNLMIQSTIRIYRSIMKGVQVELKCPVFNYDQVVLCLNTTLELIKKLAEDTSTTDTNIKRMEISLRLIEVTMEELDLSVLGSPLYKVTSNFRCLKALSANEDRVIEALNIYHDSSSDASSHVVYLTTIYFSVFSKLHSVSSVSELTLQKFHSYLKLILSSDCCPGVFHVIISLMYSCAGTWGFETWMVVSAVIKDMIGGSGDISRFKSEYDTTGYLLASYFLAYPLFICSSALIKDSNVNHKGGKNASPSSFSRDTILNRVIFVWRSIFHLFNDASKSDPEASRCFVEDLCTTMIKLLTNNSWNSDRGSINSHQESDLHCIFGEVVICVVEQIISDTIRIKDIASGSQSINLKYTLALTASFIQMTCSLNGPDHHCLIPRVFSASTCFVSCIHQIQQIILLIETLHDCLLQCITSIQTWNESSHHLELLWTEILNCLQKAQPSFVFNSTLLKSQASILEKALDHQNPSISEPTIKFWNSTYENLLQEDYPKSLFIVLEKLSRAGKLRLLQHDAENCHASQQLFESASTPGSCMVTTMHNRSSKRVELVEHDTCRTNCSDLNSKRMRLELTEHQKEVRQAQQGKGRGCSGHGPGIKTYTNLDFTQTNDDSQVLEDICNTESILELLKRPH